MPLTAAKIRAITPRDKVYRQSDSGGLYLEIHPDNARYWRWKYRLHGKEKRLALGVFPEVSLAQAREGRDAARRLLKSGVDPSAAKKADKARARHASAWTFEKVAAEWLETQQHKLAPATFEKKKWILRVLINPWLGSRPVAEIQPPELLQVLRLSEARGKYETTLRAKQIVGQVIRYGIVTGRATRNPTADLQGALKTPVVKKRAALTDPRRVAELMRAIHTYQGSQIVSGALKIAPLLFARPGELRRMTWDEIDFENEIWRIPAEKMKMREPHFVPLSKQALEILHTLMPLTGKDGAGFVFPSQRSRSRPISENTINACLRGLGFDKDTMTGHGFRAMASTLLHEQGFSSDVIERQLAHAPRNRVKAAYDRSVHLSARISMMQAWADYLDGIRNSSNVAQLHGQAAEAA